MFEPESNLATIGDRDAQARLRILPFGGIGFDFRFSRICRSGAGLFYGINYAYRS
jgi:hypothetical protein